MAHPFTRIALLGFACVFSLSLSFVASFVDSFPGLLLSCTTKLAQSLKAKLEGKFHTLPLACFSSRLTWGGAASPETNVAGPAARGAVVAARGAATARVVGPTAATNEAAHPSRTSRGGDPSGKVLGVRG